MGAADDGVVVASFNLHAGVDGWGRPFDVLGACRALAADVLVLQESWTDRGGHGPADVVAASLGYHLVTRTLARGRLAGPDPGADRRWKERRRGWRSESHALFLDSERSLRASVTRSDRYRTAAEGSWGIAMLTREPLTDVAVVDLGRLRRDPVRRAAIVGRYGSGRCAVTVVGTHMSHLFYGSPAHFRELRRALAPIVREPAVLAGDMNLWGPVVGTFLPGWRRAVRGPTWPSWRPHSQLDHILVTDAVTVAEGAVVPVGGSDHLAVRARVAPA